MLERRSFCAAIGGAVITVLLPGCAPAPTEGDKGASAPATGGAPASGKTYKIAVVPKAVSHQFWTTVKAGAEAAGKELGAEILWQGPDKETDVAKQKALIEDFITKKVDAIVMAACDSKALGPTVDKALAAKVPVITIDSGVEGDKVPLVATDNEAGAKQAGETLIKLIGGGGEVGSLPFIKGAASSEAREKGFAEAVQATGGKVKLVSTLYSNSEISGASKAVGDMLTSKPGIKGIFAANEPGVIGAANAVKQAGKQGKIFIVGFDGSPDEVEKLKDGSVAALVLQDPFKMGHDGVAAAIKAIKGEQVDKRVDTGVFVLTKENLDTPDAQRPIDPTAAATPATPGDAKKPEEAKDGKKPEPGKEPQGKPAGKPAPDKK